MKKLLHDKNRLKVLLVVPNFRWGDWDVNTLWHYIPINLCLLASVIEKDCDIRILDAHKRDLNQKDFASEVAEFYPDIVGITVLMDQYASTGHDAARIIKTINKDIKVVFGGVYATLNSEEIIKDHNVDYVVIGEGEYVFKQLLDFFYDKGPLPSKGICFRNNGNVVNRGHADFIQDLDALPFPAYHLIDFSSYANSIDRKGVDAPRAYPYAHIATSRGCPFGCSFCQVESIMGKKFRSRSAEKILDEIQWLKEKYGIKSLIFDDDNLYTDVVRAKKIFRGMIEQKFALLWGSIATAVFCLDEEMVDLMKKSGCEYIDIAIESGTERVSKKIIGKPVDFVQARKMVKYAREAGIYVAANFIIGFPTETWFEIRETIRFAEELNADYVKIFVLIPFKRTKIWDICVEHNAFKKGFDARLCRWSTGQLESNEYTPNDLTVLRAYEWDRINFSDLAKRKRIEQMMGVTESELFEIRKNTLNNACHLVAQDMQYRLKHITETYYKEK